MSQEEESKKGKGSQINDEALRLIFETLSPTKDKQAKKEEEKLTGDKRRAEEFKQVFHSIFIYAMHLLFIIGVIVFIIWVYHLVAPVCIHWLSGEQLTELDRIFFSGIVGGFVGKNFDKMFSNTTDYTQGFN